MHIDRLVMSAGLAPSISEARRKRSEHAIKINGETASELRHGVPGLPVTLTVKLGKKTKVVTLQ